MTELKNRGTEDILIAVVDGPSQYALTQAFCWPSAPHELINTRTAILKRILMLSHS